MNSKQHAITLLVIFGGLAGCATPPTQEECKAGLTRMMEIQIDEMYAPGSNMSAMMGSSMPEAVKKLGQQTLKAGIPAQLTPRIVADCVDRMKRNDLACTMSATSSDELIQKCHWKPVAGPKGAMLGY